jgi:hypothetical protein
VFGNAGDGKLMLAMRFVRAHDGSPFRPFSPFSIGVFEHRCAKSLMPRHFPAIPSAGKRS